MSPLSKISTPFLFAVVLLASTASAFTPDAAFKMRSLGIAPGAATTKTSADSKMRAPSIYQAFGGDRNVQLSLIGQENVRKSITAPPAYEDYMAVRERSLLRLLGRKN